MSSLWKDHAAVNALFATTILVAVTVAGAGVVMTTTEPFKSTNMEHHDEQVISVRQQGNRVDLINNGPRVLEVQDTWVRVVENGEHKVHRPTDLMEDATPGSEPSHWLVGDLLCVSCLYDHADIDSLTVSHGEHTIFHQHFHIPEANPKPITEYREAPTLAIALASFLIDVSRLAGYWHAFPLKARIRMRR